MDALNLMNCLSTVEHFMLDRLKDNGVYNDYLEAMMGNGRERKEETGNIWDILDK